MDVQDVDDGRPSSREGNAPEAWGQYTENRSCRLRMMPAFEDNVRTQHTYWALRDGNTKRMAPERWNEEKKA